MMTQPELPTAKTTTVSVTKFSPESTQVTQSEVVVEMPITIFLNGRELLTTLCSPVDLEYLTAGILVSEGLVSKRSDINSIKVDATEGAVYVEGGPDAECQKQIAFKPLIASGGGKGPSGYNLSHVLKDSVNSKLTITAKQVSDLVGGFLTRSSTYETTHGVHSAALCTPRKIIIFQDDIGRHNALDKIFGECFLKGIPVIDSIIITSGRISSEILLKVAKRGVPILISKAPPTNQGISLAQGVGITLIRVIKDGSILVYSHPERIPPDLAS